MGCFSACFRKSKRGRKLTNPTPRTVEFLQRYTVEAVQPARVKEKENTEIPINPNPNTIDDEQELSVSGRKKVTFDLNVQAYEKLPATDENRSNGEESEKEESNCSSSSQIPLPKNYRYQNCRDSDEDEFVDELVSDDDNDHDYMGDDEDEESQYEVSDDSLISSDKSSLSSSMDSMNEKLATSNSKVTDEVKSSDSVLHPVENLSQWKLEPQNKENNMNVMNTKSKNSSGMTMAVDTSLSSWLNTSTTKSRVNSVSVGSYEDRPILGVLTVEEIRQFSVTSTPRRSPSPDDMPIIGSVGSYWRS